MQPKCEIFSYFQENSVVILNKTHKNKTAYMHCTASIRSECHFTLILQTQSTQLLLLANKFKI